MITSTHNIKFIYSNNDNNEKINEYNNIVVSMFNNMFPKLICDLSYYAYTDI